MPDPQDSGLGSRFIAAAESPGLALWHVTHRWQAAMRAALAPHALTHVQYVLLATLVWQRAHHPDAAVTQSDLAALAATDPMMTSQVLRALEGKGLVERRPHPDDRRARMLQPTADGIATAQAATHDVEAADERFFAPLADAAGFGRELSRLLPPATSSRFPDRP